MAWNGLGSGKDGSLERFQHKSCGWSGSRRRGRRAALVCLPIAALVLVAFICIALFSGKTDIPGGTRQKYPCEASKIAEVMPATVIKTVPAATKPDYKRLYGKALRKVPESETNRLSAAQVEYWRMFHPFPPPNGSQPAANRGAWEIFGNRAENEIAGLLSIEPGETVIGQIAFEDGFVRRLRRSLMHPIVVEDGDSDYVRNLKHSVSAAKEQLKDAMDRGEDVGMIMASARDELQRLGKYRAELEKQAERLVRRGATAEDVEDVVGAINKLMETKGLAPIELNSMSRLAIKYNMLKADKNQENVQIERTMSNEH